MQQHHQGQAWSICISAEELREITERLRWAVANEEHASEGHVLLEVEGSRRTWVTSDGGVTLVMRATGAPPKCDDLSIGSHRVLIHSRILRRVSAENSLLRVINHGTFRELELTTGGLTTRIPEPLDEFPDWRAQFAAADGPQLTLNPQELRDAIIRATNIPLGLEDEPIHTWLNASDGVVRFHTPWVNYFDVEVEIATPTQTIETPPALFDVRRIQCGIHLVDDLCGDINVTLPSTPMAPLRISGSEFDALVLPTDRWIDVRNTLEETLRAVLKSEHVRPDEDGDYLITNQKSCIWTRLNTETSTPIVQIYSVLASGVPKSVDVFQEVNSINCQTRLVKLLWTGETLVAETSFPGSQIDPMHFDFLRRQVQIVAERYEPILGAYFQEHEQPDTLF